MKTIIAGTALLSLVSCAVPPSPHPDPANWPQISESSAEWRCAGPAGIAALQTPPSGIVFPVRGILVMAGDPHPAERAAHAVRKECLRRLGWLTDRAEDNQPWLRAP